MSWIFIFIFQLCPEEANHLQQGPGEQTKTFRHSSKRKLNIEKVVCVTVTVRTRRDTELSSRVVTEQHWTDWNERTVTYCGSRSGLSHPVAVGQDGQMRGLSHPVAVGQDGQIVLDPRQDCCHKAVGTGQDRLSRTASQKLSKGAGCHKTGRLSWCCNYVELDRTFKMCCNDIVGPFFHNNSNRPKWLREPLGFR